MTPLRKLESRIKQTFPDARLDVSEPATPDGVGFLDVSYRGNVIAIQWEKGLFGVASPEGHGYGEKPDEVYRSADEAANRISALLKSGGKTQPPLEVTLRELRIERNLPQKGLADRLGITQPAVSKCENRVSRMMISSLRAVVQAMGGRLIIQVSFPGEVVRQIALDDDPDTQAESDAVVANG